MSFVGFLDVNEINIFQFSLLYLCRIIFGYPRTYIPRIYFDHTPLNLFRAFPYFSNCDCEKDDQKNVEFLSGVKKTNFSPIYLPWTTIFHFIFNLICQCSEISKKFRHIYSKTLNDLNIKHECMQRSEWSRCIFCCSPHQSESRSMTKTRKTL